MRVQRSWTSGALLVLLCGASVGCHRTAGWWMNSSGRAHYRAGRYSAAQQDFWRAVADHPANADYRHNLAMSLHKQGRLAEAETVYRQALNLDRDHQPSYHGLASLLRDQRRYSEAAALLAAWAAAQPYNPEAHIEMAWWNREAGDLAAAEQSLRQALLSRPNHPVALSQLGQLYEQTGQPKLALSMYQRSLHADRFQPPVQQRVAMLRDRLYGSRPPAYATGTVSAQRFASSWPPPRYAAGAALRPAPGIRAGRTASDFNADPAHAR